VLAQGRDLAQLQAEFASQARAWVQEVAKQSSNSIHLRSGIRSWDFPDLAENLPQQRGDMRIMAYPALHDDGDSVSVTLYDTQAQAEREHRRGLVRLAALSLPQQIKYLQKELLRDNRVRLALTAVAASNDIMQDMIDTVVAAVFFSHGQLPRSQSDFEACLAAHKSAMVESAQQLDTVIGKSALLAQQIQQQLDALKAPEAKVTVQDIRSQLSALWFAGFVRAAPYEQLLQYHRYMEAIQKRLEKLRGAVARDQQTTMQLQKYWSAVLTWRNKKSVDEWTAAQHELRWLLEEWRIALFAQPMKTRVPVSEKKIAELFTQVMR
jgi:ATP-dependent helicase HrpA